MPAVWLFDAALLVVALRVIGISARKLDAESASGMAVRQGFSTDKRLILNDPKVLSSLGVCDRGCIGCGSTRG